MGKASKCKRQPPVYSAEPIEESGVFGKFYKPIDPQAREQQMIGLAVELAEQKLRDGTATSQIIEHYLKLATTRTNLEIQMAEQQLALLKAKTAAIESENSEKRDYAAVLEAMRRYNGIEDDYVEQFQ